MTDNQPALEKRIDDLEIGLERCQDDIAALNGTSQKPQHFRLPLDQTKQGMVAVLACVVQILAERHQSLPEDVCAKLGDLDKQLLDNGSPHGSDIVWALTKALGKS